MNNIQTDLSVYIEGDNSLFLNYERYKFMVERMIEFAEKNGSDTITIFCSDNKITVIDDGEYDESVDKKSIFDFGKNSPGSGTTYILPFVKTVVDIEFGHIEVDESYEKGLKYSIIIEKNISK